MEVKNYQDEAGVWFRELISKEYQPLFELRKEYEKNGKETWMNPYDNGRWVLTIKVEKEK